MMFINLSLIWLHQSFADKTWVVERISMMNLTEGYSQTLLILVPLDILKVSTLRLLGHTRSKEDTLLNKEDTRHKVILRKGTTHLKATHQQDTLLVLTHHLDIPAHLLHTSQV
jgi:hypothetical protein